LARNEFAGNSTASQRAFDDREADNNGDDDKTDHGHGAGQDNHHHYGQD
jgi:hypothetical protein